MRSPEDSRKYARFSACRTVPPSGLHLDRHRRMSLRSLTRVVFVLMPQLLSAQAPPHVRPESAMLRALTAQASAQSPIVHALIDRLDQTDVIVYVRHRLFG